MKLSNIHGEHIQKLYNSLNDRGIAVSYIKIVGAILNGCFKQALKNGLIERNPVPLATLPREREKKQRRVLTVEEQKMFLNMQKHRICLTCMHWRSEQDYVEAKSEG